MSDFPPTPEQENICSLIKEGGHLQVVSYAGTGKTSTGKMIAKLMRDVLYVAFNKRIIEEALQGFPGDARTFNSIGWQAWRATISGSCQVDGKKVGKIFREVVKEYKGEDADNAWDAFSEISETITLAKARGYIPDSVPRNSRRLVGEEFWSTIPATDLLQRKIVDEILVRSIQLAYAGQCDFDDQVYMPTVFGGSFPHYPEVIVDEEQDLNDVNHAIVDRLIKGSRLTTFGDPFQSIYAFRGAKQNGMEINRERRGMRQASLSVSFRCRQRIVENARWRVPAFRYFREGGVVGVLPSLGMGEIAEGSAIICRNNAPLFKLAIQLLSSGRACKVAGSDIGVRLVGTLKRLGDASLPQAEVLNAIDKWESKKEGRGDMADCLRVFAYQEDDLGEAIRHAEFVLRQTGPLTLITGHKAKGLEWDTVYHLNPWMIKEDEQEKNLRYVIQTRAKDAYYEIDAEAIH